MAGHVTTSCKLVTIMPKLFNKSSVLGCPVLMSFQRHKGKTHVNPKFKKERQEKFLKVDLPIYQRLKKDQPKAREDMTADELRMEYKKLGMPFWPKNNRSNIPITFSCTNGLFDEYKPTPGEGRQSDLLHSGIGDVGDKSKRFMKTTNAKRTLRKFEDFEDKTFAEQAHQIFVEVNTLLQDVYKNQDLLHELVTEFAFPKMVHGLETKTMKWQFVETVEPAKIVQVRVEDMITKDNKMAQVTVRFHTKQILAIYDRFGRLMFGDSQLPKSCIEYVVFEKWVSDTYGTWRIHAKITPPDAQSSHRLIKTYRIPNETLDPAEDENEVKDTEVQLQTQIS